MCLYPKFIKNRKYTSTKKNGGVVPLPIDPRVKEVPVGCQQCIECRQQKKRNWQIRLLEDIRENTNGKFITLTFSDESIAELTKDVNNYILHEGKRIPHKRNLSGYILDNEIATRAMRLFNERWRKKYKKAIRHWLVTELGHNGTENIHLHGIIWTDLDNITAYREIESIWKYGHIWPRSDRERRKTYVNNRTINYTIKYVSKKDLLHKEYNSIILTSPGIGSNYMKREDWKKNRYKGINTDETYKSSTGHKMSLPIYWRNKIYSEDERERLWLHKLDKEERWVMGERISIKKGIEEFDNTVKYYRKLNLQLGYGSDEKNEERKEYERARRKLMQETRIKKGLQKIQSLRGGNSKDIGLERRDEARA